MGRKFSFVGSNTEANVVRIAIWSLIICSAVDMFEVVVCGGQEMVSEGEGVVCLLLKRKHTKKAM